MVPVGLTGNDEFGIDVAIDADVVVVGASIGDNQRTDAPSGVVRGFHAASGRLAWAFDLAPPDFDYDADRVFLLGFSQGVAMAFRMAAQGIAQPKGVIACGGDLPPDPVAEAQ